MLNQGKKESLSPLYRGPYKVLRKEEKYFELLLENRITTVSIDRLKAAHELFNSDSDSTMDDETQQTESEGDELLNDEVTQSEEENSNHESNTQRLRQPPVKFRDYYL